MTEKKTCYNCGNKKCHIFYSTVKQDVEEHHETYEYTEFDCVNHDKWEELKVEEIRTDSTKTLKNAKKMTEDEISKIKEHIEIHARREPRAIKITAILRKAVDELERIERLENENAELKKRIEWLDMAIDCDIPVADKIAELEEKISVLLSCENCPENKDGLICRKEYENKCLAQKIQFIKELQQENAELKARLNAINQLIPELEKENAELKAGRPKWHKVADGDLPKGENHGRDGVHRDIYLKDRYGNLYTGNYFPKDENHEEDCFAVNILDWGFRGSQFCKKEQISEWCEILQYTEE